MKKRPAGKKPGPPPSCLLQLECVLKAAWCAGAAAQPHALTCEGRNHHHRAVILLQGGQSCCCERHVTKEIHLEGGGRARRKRVLGKEPTSRENRSDRERGLDVKLETQGGKNHLSSDGWGQMLHHEPFRSQAQQWRSQQMYLKAPQ